MDVKSRHGYEEILRRRKAEGKPAVHKVTELERHKVRWIFEQVFCSLMKPTSSAESNIIPI